MGNVRELLEIVVQAQGCNALLRFFLDFLESFAPPKLGRERPHLVVANRRKYWYASISHRLNSPAPVSPILVVKSSEYKITGHHQECWGFVSNLVDDLLACFGVGYDFAP